LTIFREYARVFEEKENIDLWGYPKSKMRLLDAIEKQRKQLSANNEAPINVEYLCEEIDFSHMMNKEQFEKLSAPIFDKFTALVQEALKESGFSAKEFHSVEVIGG